jgi:hypothetical protein
VQFLGTVLGRGSGRTKKDAEQAAAKSALEKTSETSALAQAAADTAARGANAVHEADTIPDGPSGRELIEREGLKIADPRDGEPGSD